ncbi:cyclase family protein [Sphaerimonospora sp. CA-214678]|uniref:cyclase family protein n=1 Tax=Sphaerimonospora sp. CA-214678 TaxID=3240029 RepID=UPI003D912DC6
MGERAGRVSRSPFGSADEIGMLNLMTPASREAIMSRIDGAAPYDLAVDYFVGMPSWVAAGDQPYQVWMTHTPEGTRVDNAPGAPAEQNEMVAYSGDALSMYTHTGTHIDALNHFGYGDTIYNGFTARDHLGSRGWTRAGADRHPPIVARGILLDIAALHGVDELPPGHPIGDRDLDAALDLHQVDVRRGDVVLIRTGRMRAWPDPQRYLTANPGLDLGGAQYLARRGVMMVGIDAASIEYTPHDDEVHWNPVHCFLLAEAGVAIMEVADLEALAADRVYEFGLVAAGLKLRGATGTPVRPVAFPIKRSTPL